MKLNKKYLWVAIIWTCFLFNSALVQAQMQTAHWYFGGFAGLDFTSGAPVADTDGQINYGEGSTAISDEYGNLLFYTDGRKVYDSSHNQMPNGSGLWGFPTCTQPAVIVPMPGTCDLYYIFTIDVRDPEVSSFRTKKGLAYSVVDMSLNNGLGDIVLSQKNINIPIDGAQQGYEKLTVVSNENRTGYWMLTHFEGNFYAFEVTSEGINTNAVMSPTPGTFGGTQFIGNLKASPDGSKLAMAFGLAFCTDGGLAIYDFNDLTGEVSNEIVLDAIAETSGQRNFYGVEFSPNSQILYAACAVPSCEGGFDPNEGGYHILQYDLLSSTIVATEELVSDNPYGQGGLQLGLDNKIYFSQGTGSVAQSTLNRIEDPNTLYDFVNSIAPTVTFEAVDLDGRNSGGNLPQFLTHYFRSSFTVNDTENGWVYCSGSPLEFNFCSQGGIIESIHWDFGNGFTSNQMYPTHTYAVSGVYDVTVTMQVEGQGEFVRILEVEILSLPTIDYVEMQPACFGEPTEINITTNALSVFWYEDSEAIQLVSNSNPFTTPPIFEPTTWYVVVDDGSCQSNPMAVTATNTEELLLFTTDTLICRGDSASLKLQVTGGREPYVYQWTAGYTDPDVTVSPNYSMTYDVKVTDDCGIETSTAAQVTISPVKARFSFDIENVFDVDFTNHSFPFGQVESNWDFGDGRTSDVFEPFHRYTSTDDYPVMLTVTDTYGCVDTTQKLVPFPVQVYIPTAFSPNEDGINDLFKVVAEDAEEVELWIFDRWGSQVHHQKAKEVCWNGSNNADGFYVPTGVYTYMVVVNLWRVRLMC